MRKEHMEMILEDYFQNVCKDNEQCKKADKELSVYTDNNTNRATSFEIDWLASQAIYQHERQGFIGGFMYAMNLLGRQGGLMA